MTTPRLPDGWSTRLGVILAVAGSAIGLGNFLRFPTMVAKYGGGAFLIPYLVALLLIGLPLMWMEWAFGRHGGTHGRHTLPGIYDVVAKGRRWAKYLGVLGLYVPFVIVIYYTYIESWLLGYAFFSAAGAFANTTDPAGFGKFLGEYLGAGDGPVATPTLAWLFLAITVGLNFYVIYRGVSRGIEKLSRVAMPLLFLIAGVLMVRVLTLPGALEGLAYMWKPDLTQLWKIDVWLAAAGQIFFTLSLGLGAIITYSSYLKKDEDVAKAGLQSAGVNEFAEVVLGGAIVIPAAVAVFSISIIPTIIEQTKNGVVGFSLTTMPAIFNALPLGQYVSVLWFALLFIAGITSSVSLLQPLVAFLQDEFGWTRRRAATIILGAALAYLAPVVLFSGVFIDDMDYWCTNLLLPLGGLIEVLMFALVLGLKKGWEELTRGAEIRMPGFIKWVIAIVTPAFLVILLGVWGWQQVVGLAQYFREHGALPAISPELLASRLVMLGVFLAMIIAVAWAWRLQRAGKVPTPTPEAVEEGSLAGEL